MIYKVAFFEPYPEKLLGSQKVLLQLLHNLDRDKIEPVLVCATTGQLTEAIPQEIETHILAPKGILQERNWITDNKLNKLFKSPSLIFQFAWNLLLYWQELRQFFQENQFTLVYCNSSFRATFLAGIPARLAGIPTILHEHSSVLQKPNLLLRLCYWLSNRVIFVSKDMLKKLTFNPKGQKFSVVYNGVGLSSSLLPISQPETELKTICFIGRLTRRKNLHILIEAIAKLQTKPKLRLLIVGDGEAKYIEELYEQVEKLKLEQVVQFCGRQENVMPFLIESNFLVLPSSQESFGLVILESYSVQRPVIATAVGGITEVVIDGETGLLVPPNDSDALRDALEKLLFNPEQAAKMGVSGYELWQRKFTLQQNIEKITQLIMEVIEPNLTKDTG